MLCPTFIQPPPGSDAAYDTLDNLDLPDNVCVEHLFDLLYSPLKSAVGVVVTGENGLFSNCHWGRCIMLPTGEFLQVRIYPRNSTGKPMCDNETRFIAIRRTSQYTIPCVGYGVFYQLRNVESLNIKTPTNSGFTIGCRSVHIVLPSLFSKHDPHRDKSTGHAQLDPKGYHSIRPSTLCLTGKRGLPKGARSGFLFTSPGDAYMVIAGHVGGVDIADPPQRSSGIMADCDYSKRTAAHGRRLIKGMGESRAVACISSSLTLCDLLSAEGTLGVLSNAFFNGAIPDMMHVPMGITLEIVMAVNIACHPERFGLPPCTAYDEFANMDTLRAFRSRWDKVMLNGFRAIDFAVKTGYDNAKSQASNAQQSSMHLRDIEDNLKFWQRVGQRVISKLASNPTDEMRSDYQTILKTRFGTADLLVDSVSNCKYSEFAKKGFLTPVAEAPIDRILMAPRSDVKTTLYRIQDDTEWWLRTGRFGLLVVNRPNVNVAQVADQDARNSRRAGVQTDAHSTSHDTSNAETVSSPSSDSDDNDHILDNKICQDALEAAVASISTAMLHGAYTMHQFNMQCYLVAESCKNKCADCDKDVGVVQGTLFATKASECARCNRKRCFACSIRATRSPKAPDECCLRCAADAPSAYKSLAQLAHGRK